MALPTIASATSSAPAEASALARSEVAISLRKGGYVIYFRHAATDFSKNDARMTSYADCANQRLLSRAGRSSARQVGRHIARLGVPIGESFARPLCRTPETDVRARHATQRDVRRRQR
ncbi:MAG: hypothetical protein JWP47_2317 [Polaromonas sp.]|nr:hypothetical protein [Polaromonas sp.]